MRIAIVHDWLTGMRGGEKVLSLLCRLFPNADLLTLFHTPGACDRHIERMPIITSPLNHLPFVHKYYRHLLPLMPFAVERLPASHYDLIISCSHCVAKGVLRSPHSIHLCYCFTPMRYIWNAADAYASQMGLTGLALRALTAYLRAWDLRSARHVDAFLANSHAVARRIQTHYHRHAQVVYSPIDPAFYTPDNTPRENFYLMVTALSPYKRVDHAIAAFDNLRLPLRIIGSGPEFPRLSRNLPTNIQLLGWQSNNTIRQHYRRCRALLMPGEEDFGLVPLEANACGAPVIALAAGGALETVINIDHPAHDSPTGLLYTPHTVDGLVNAVQRFEALQHRFDPQCLAAWARHFGPDRFIREFKQALRPLLEKKGLGDPWSNDTIN
ncbi:MAG: glycosyltransferase [Planctomycetota bacterium]|nr:glycosyltransferase [Planctomycetota bacterium]